MEFGLGELGGEGTSSVCQRNICDARRISAVGYGLLVGTRMPMKWGKFWNASRAGYNEDKKKKEEPLLVCNIY